MAVAMDIFAPQISAVAEGLAGKVFFIYGGNNLGKTYVAARMPKPFFIACESGLNAIAGVRYNRANGWADVKKLVNQLTGKKTVDKARELYDTIVLDEVYAFSLFCQDFVCQVHGDGALTLGDNADPRKNLYQIYEKEMFRLINQLLSCDYTVVFIGHAQEKDGYVSPKGDKRLLGPIIDNSDFTIYLSSNGVDENGKVILSTAHFAETDTFFARSRFTECVTEITPFSAENLEKVVKDAVAAEAAKSGIAAISYEEQKAQNVSETVEFEEIVEMLRELSGRYQDSDKIDEWQEKVEDILGKGKTVGTCTKKQTQALIILYNELLDQADELGI